MSVFLCTCNSYDCWPACNLPAASRSQSTRRRHWVCRMGAAHIVIIATGPRIISSNGAEMSGISVQAEEAMGDHEGEEGSSVGLAVQG